MSEGDAKRRQYYLAKIKEARQLAARADDPEVIRDMEIMIDGYKKLLGRLPPATGSEG